MRTKPQIILADVKGYCIDGVLTGHVCAVAQNYLDIFRGQADIRIAGGPAFGARFPGALCLSHHAEASASPQRNKLCVLHNMWQLLRRCRENILIFQSSAVATVFFGIAFFKFSRSPLYMIQYNADSVSTPIKRLLFSLAKGKISGIICPNKEVGEAYGLPYCVVPDYIYTGKDAGDMVPYEEKKYDFCMVGVICEDKGMVAAAAKLAGTPHRVIIAGKPASAEIEQQLRSIAAAVDNIELRLRFIDEKEYGDIIRFSRYGVLNYSGAYSDHSSGVVFDILFSGLPVFGRRCKSLKIIEEHGMGQLFDDIEEWDVSRMPDKAVYDTYRQHIYQYYRTHERSRQELVSFVTRAEGN